MTVMATRRLRVNLDPDGVLPTTCKATNREGLPCQRTPVIGMIRCMAGERKTGYEPTPHVSSPPTDDLMELVSTWPVRFSSKVQFGDGCWTWTACTTASGYGRYGRGGRRTGPGTGTDSAFRVAYELTYGSIPDGFDGDHLCRNRACVRPDHIEFVPHSENVRRGRASNISGFCRSGRHEWVPGNILTEGNGVQRCLLCRREWEHQRPPRSRG